MSTVDPDMGALVRKAMEGMGIGVRTGETVRAIDVDGRPGRRRRDRPGQPARPDIVVLGLGVRPNTDLAEAGRPARSARTGGVC